MVGNSAYKFILATAGVACNLTEPVKDVMPDCTLNQMPRKILIASMIAYEADTLQIALAEYDGVADVLLTENLNLHNPHERQSKPFYLWPRVKNRPEFAVRKSKVFWHRCTEERKTTAVYEAEDADERCTAEKVRDLTRIHGFDIVVAGDIDELVGRREVLKLKWCKTIQNLPTKGAIGMPLGKIGRSFRSDWPPNGMPWALSAPNFYGSDTAMAGNAKRNIGAFRGVPPIVGGLHLTNYCFFPAMIVKELWNADYGHNMDKSKACQTSLERAKEQCYGLLSSRVRDGVGKETITPLLLERCPALFPAWFGKIDPREQHFYSALCRTAL